MIHDTYRNMIAWYSSKVANDREAQAYLQMEKNMFEIIIRLWKCEHENERMANENRIEMKRRKKMKTK